MATPVRARTASRLAQLGAKAAATVSRPTAKSETAIGALRPTHVRHAPGDQHRDRERAGRRRQRQARQAGRDAEIVARRPAAAAARSKAAHRSRSRQRPARSPRAGTPACARAGTGRARRSAPATRPLPPDFPPTRPARQAAAVARSASRAGPLIQDAGCRASGAVGPSGNCRRQRHALAPSAPCFTRKCLYKTRFVPAGG